MNGTSETLSESISLERRGDAAVLWLDIPGKPVNVLREHTSEELMQALATVEREQELKAVVIASAKPAGFLAGADVRMLRGLERVEQAQELSRRAHAVMDRIANFAAPIVAAIHGACLGGGLELALACRGRVASNARETKLGLPEVKLGLVPGAGGTQRLPRLVGLEDALQMILTGRELSGAQALEIGLIDELVEPSILLDAAVERARELIGEQPRTRERDESLAEALRTLLTERTPIGRWFIYRQARRRTSAKTHGNISAPMRAIELIRDGLEQGIEVGLQREAKVFGELALSREARHLMRLFEARTELGAESGVSEDVEPRRVDKIGVLGAGLMGSGIAYVSAAEAGVHVRLEDLENERLLAGLRSVREIVDERLGKGKIDEFERERVLARIHPTTRYDGFGRADLVIEAVAEQLEVKREVLREIEAVTHEQTIFASNTSAIPIARIAEAAARPHNVVGMHYFSPVEKVPLLEVVRAEASSPSAVATAVEFGKRQGRVVIVVNDGPGFFTSRVLGRYLAEVAALLMEGAEIDAIDQAMENVGFAVGPLRLLDEVGIDVALGVAKTLVEAFGERFSTSEVLERIVADGREGRKNGRGFYRYEEGERVDHEVDESIYELLGVKPIEVDSERISQRCLDVFANESAWCHGDGIVRSARDADIGAVFGLGFPAHLGGPLTMIDEEGSASMLARMQQLRAERGPAHAPAPVLEELARRGCGFYDDAAPKPGWHR
jgi:3-hydroxyacyl-CoA dehydrogenase/enoyl-CoA hydratase/3-hydroxybutyryl-CoA epimerase